MWYLEHSETLQLFEDAVTLQKKDQQTQPVMILCPSPYLLSCLWALYPSSAERYRRQLTSFPNSSMQLLTRNSTSTVTCTYQHAGFNSRGRKCISLSDSWPFLMCRELYPCRCSYKKLLHKHFTEVTARYFSLTGPDWCNWLVNSMYFVLYLHQHSPQEQVLAQHIWYSADGKIARVHPACW